MKGLSKVALAVAIATGLLFSLPGAIAADAGGQVSGTVTLANPGIPLNNTCTTTAYTFSEVLLRGALRNLANDTFAGTVDTGNVKGGSDANQECTSMGEGNVNSLSDLATFQGIGDRVTSAGVHGPGAARGLFYGRYVRRESLVFVTLNVKFKVCSGGLGTCTINAFGWNDSTLTAITVRVQAQFTPNTVYTGPGGPGITQANFTGTWGTVIPNAVEPPPN